jgi:hypothetical protein
MITPLSEYTYFCFPESQVVRQFQHIPAFGIDAAGNIILSRKADLDAEGCRRFLIEKHGHKLDELCGVWRYVFFMQFPRTRCVRYERIGAGLISIGEISAV